MAANDTTIQNLELIGGSYYGIHINFYLLGSAPANTRILHTKVHHSGYVGIKAADADNLLIEDSEVYQTGTRLTSGGGIDVMASLPSSANPSGPGATIRGNYVHDLPAEGIVLKSGTVNGVIEGNRVENIAGGGIAAGGDAGAQYFRPGVTSECRNCLVRNNIVNRTDKLGLSCWGAQGVRIFNNTVVNAANTGQAALFVVPDRLGYGCTGVVQNNLFTGTGNSRLVHVVRPGGSLSVDYNLYYNSSGRYSLWWESPALTGYWGSLADWQSGTGRDSHSIAAQPPLLDPANLNRPASGSPAIDHGVNLAEVTADYAGVPRPQGAATDIGAFEYATQSAAVPPASAVFVRSDTATRGSWVGAYGSQGQLLVHDTPALPSWAAANSADGALRVWSDATTDVRALQHAWNPSSRVEAAWYGPEFDVTLALKDGQEHQVALYCADYDSTGRQQVVDVYSASTGALLDSRSLATFDGGAYLIWNIQGDVRFHFTRTSGASAVLSGILLDPVGAAVPVANSASAAFVKSDGVTGGSWMGAYGSEGQSIVRDPAVPPAWARVTPAGQFTWSWSDNTADLRALQHTTAPSTREMAAWYGGVFTVDLQLTDGKTHQVALYAADYAARGRQQIVEVLDAGSSAVLDSRTLAGFSGGTYLVWNIKGAVRFRFRSTAGPNAVVSGFFFDPVGGSGGALAAFVASDSTTAGSWIGKYGSEGQAIVNDPAALPSWIKVGTVGQRTWTWSANTTDPRALQHASNPALRGMAAWYGASFEVDANVFDRKVHRVALYAADYDTTERHQTVEVVSAATGAVLDRRTLTSFHGGTYLVWHVTGIVRFRFTGTAGANAVVSGLFLDPAL